MTGCEGFEVPPLHLILISIPHTALMYITAEGAGSASGHGKAERAGSLTRGKAHR